MSRRVMLVDDSIGTRGILKFTLKREDYDCLEAPDGAEALDMLRRDRVDCVITDYWMPNMTGLELVRAIRSDQKLRHLPVLVVTTDSHPDRKTELQEAGATGWIIKPFQPDDLLNAVRRMTA